MIQCFWRATVLTIAVFGVLLLVPAERAGAGVTEPTDVTWIDNGHPCRYFKGTAEPTPNDLTAWTDLGFDELAPGWLDGNVSVGYGDGDDNTNLPDMRNNYLCVYVRMHFTVDDPLDLDVPGQLITLAGQSGIEISYDDGFILYLNGTEILRANTLTATGVPQPFDRTDGSGRATPIVIGDAAFAPFAFDETAQDRVRDALVPGDNVLAVQSINRGLTSSDLTFIPILRAHLEPHGPDETPPVVAALQPTPGALIRVLNQIDVTFTESVIGVDAADLRINGLPAAAVGGSNRGPYSFTFPQPADGPVAVAWAPDHEIYDLAEIPNPFAGGNWAYTVDSTLPPGDLVINEILASNGAGRTDEDGDSSDWIEIRNRDSVTVNLLGWSLTDDAEEPGKWTFPNVSIGPGGYVVVFASGKDRRPTDGRSLHTDFSLSAAGEFLGLYSPDSPRRLVSGLAPEYPEQRPDISYGLDNLGVLTYLTNPTPGSANDTGSAIAGFVADTRFSHDRGFYELGFNVAITSDTPGALIRYTDDGSAPSRTNGTDYTEPVRIETTTCLRAIAYKTGLLPTNVDTQTYIFLDHVLSQPSNPPGFPSSWRGTTADYEMDPEVVGDARYSALMKDALLSLPTMSIVTHVDNLFSDSGIYSNPGGQGVSWERPASVEWINPDGTTGFQEDAGLRIYGGAFRGMGLTRKKTFRLLFKRRYGATKLDFPLFDDEDAATRFDTIILRGGANDAWNNWGGGNTQYIVDEWMRRTQLALGQPASHGTFVHLYVNGLYWGLYNPVERPEASFSATYFGGAKEEWDALNSAAPTGDSNTVTWNAMLNQVRGGLGDTASYQRIQGNNPDGTNNPTYDDLLDIDNYVDYMFSNFLGGTGDWPGHNWYAACRRPPNATGFKSFNWDSEGAIVVWSSLNANVTGVGNSLAEPYAALQSNTEFRVLFGDHLQRHLFNGGPATAQANFARYQELSDTVEMAIIAESARWGDQARSAPYTLADWQKTRDYVLDTYMPQRPGIVLQQLRNRNLYPGVAAPTFNQHGGIIDADFVLTISGPTGTILYTLDDSDPRLPGGAVAPTATEYGAPIAIDASTIVKARVQTRNGWTALAEATFIVEIAPVLRLTEIMYHPEDPPDGSPYSDNDFEFLELQNTGDTPLALERIRLTKGVDFVFPAITLPAGEAVLVVANETAFASRYDTAGMTIAGEWELGDRLSNGGERIRLEGTVGETIVDFVYDDDWYPITDGKGYSLSIVDPRAPLETWGSQTSWRPSDQRGGSPALIDDGVFPGSVVINEVLSRTGDPRGDWIELQNTTGETIAVGGWFLSDDSQNLAKFRISAGTTIPAGGHLAFNQRDHFGNAGHGGTREPFALADLGGAAYLTAADAGGALRGYRESVRFGAIEADVTFGRHVKSTGAADFVAMSEPTYERENAYPMVGPVVINEIMYHPPAGDAEFLELHNLTAAVLPLYDPANPTNPWKFTAGIDYAFPPGAEIPANGYALVVRGAPADFRADYGIAPEVPIFGPHPSRLDDGGEALELSSPDAPQPGGSAPYIVIERVRYNDKPPWPERADGNGSALGRQVPEDYGNDPANWSPSVTGGTPGRANLNLDGTPPTVPTDLALTVVTDAQIDLAWTGSVDAETSVAFYRVYRNGITIGTAPAAGFSDTRVATDTSYSYQVSAVNLDGFESARSMPAVQITLLGIEAAFPADTTHVIVVFPEPVDKAVAENVGHYALDNRATVQAATQGADRRMVTLTTSPLNDGTWYTLTVTGMVAVSGNEVAPNAQASFVAGTGLGLRGDYYNDRTFTNLVLTRIDPVVDFNWGSGSPDPTVNANDISVRWTGQVSPLYSEVYTFYTYSDDGVRLWVDNRLVIDNWTDHGPTEDAGQISLQTGRAYDIRMEWYERGGGAVAGLSWSSPSQTKQIIPETRLSTVLAPTLSIDDATVTEGDGGTVNAVFTVRLSFEGGEPVTVRYATANGTATAGRADSDYDARTGILTFNPGAGLTKTITVPVNGDTDPEPDEFFYVNLFDAEGAILLFSQGTGTIETDDAPQPGDFDADGDIDLADYLVMHQGFSGAGVPTPDPRTDLDGDGDTDLADLLAFQAAFTGPR